MSARANSPQKANTTCSLTSRLPWLLRLIINIAVQDKRKAKNKTNQPELKSKIKFMPQTELRAPIKAFPKTCAKTRFELRLQAPKPASDYSRVCVIYSLIFSNLRVLRYS
jgi:hypothetical protein